MSLTPDERFLLVVENYAFLPRVAVYRATDGVFVRHLGKGPGDPFSVPMSVAVVPSTGEVLVSDCGRNQVVRIQSIDNDAVTGVLGVRRGVGSLHFFNPSGLAVLDGLHCPPVRV